MRFLKASALTASFLLNAVLLLAVVSFLVAPVVLAKKKVSLQNVVEQLALLENALTGKLEESVNVESMAATTLSTKLDELVEVASRAEGSRWPPRPENIINYYGGEAIGVVGGMVKTIFEVPQDKWLIITNLVSIQPDTFELVEITDEGLAVKLGRRNFNRSINPQYPPFVYNSVTGLAFAPGSKVAVRNSDTQSAGNEISLLTFTGYLTD